MNYVIRQAESCNHRMNNEVGSIIQEKGEERDTNGEKPFLRISYPQKIHHGDNGDKEGLRLNVNTYPGAVNAWLQGLIPNLQIEVAIDKLNCYYFQKKKQLNAGFTFGMRK